MICDTKIAKVSIVGAGMNRIRALSSKIWRALDADINIQMISTSEIKISVLIDVQDAQRALM